MGDVGSEMPAAKTESKSTNLFLQVVQQPDGTVSRPSVPLAPPTPDASPDAVRSKDVPLDPTHSTSLRLYLPAAATATAGKIPIILYFHGGGFVLFSTASVFYHNFCQQLAAALPALVVSLDYRLAPESRLPAAYDDAVEALLWVRAASDPWLAAHGDLSRCFLMGHSSGANMVYHAGLLAASLELAPASLAGLMLNQPYFGGVERTPSEMASEEDAIIPLRANDAMWRLALPEGADRDHPFSNPVHALPVPVKGELRLPRCLVKGYIGDPLYDRQREFAAMLERSGVSVVAKVQERGFHAVELFDPDKARALLDEVKEFVFA